jgi:hypothetical protein
MLNTLPGRMCSRMAAWEHIESGCPGSKGMHVLPEVKCTNVTLTGLHAAALSMFLGFQEIQLKVCLEETQCAVLLGASRMQRV